MNFNLTKTQELFRQMIREFAEKEVKPLAAEIDEQERFPAETVKKMAELGIFGIPVPTQYGGAGGNIKALADKLNPDFYDYVLNCGLQQTTGPTGVVLIDYVSDDPTSAAYALPGTIIANNFKHSISGGDDVEGGEGDENEDNGSGL